MKILIVEDNIFALKSLQGKFEQAGYLVETASDGIRALNTIRTSPPDLILLDIMLPRLDGYKVCKLLKKDNRFASIPVLMLTSKAGRGDRDMGIETGADDFFLKSTEIGDLLSAINQHISPG